jgi:hypothetical protein
VFLSAGVLCMHVFCACMRGCACELRALNRILPNPLILDLTLTDLALVHAPCRSTA